MVRPRVRRWRAACQALAGGTHQPPVGGTYELLVGEPTQPPVGGTYELLVGEPTSCW